MAGTSDYVDQLNAAFQQNPGYAGLTVSAEGEDGRTLRFTLEGLDAETLSALVERSRPGALAAGFLRADGHDTTRVVSHIPLGSPPVAAAPATGQPQVVVVQGAARQGDPTIRTLIKVLLVLLILGMIWPACIACGALLKM